tara:strand:+ start:158746 stop:159288 length:543 start_codon:yes stop_codon:yes gene_type:complete
MAEVNKNGLGKTQLDMLNSLYRHHGWYAGCGWLWNTKSGTVRILEALLKRGLVANVANSSSTGKYILTDAGIEVLCEDSYLFKARYEASLAKSKSKAGAVIFRPHRPNLEGSLELAVEVSSKEALVDAIKKRYSFLTVPVTVESLEFKEYGYDERINWDTQVVTLKDYGVLGFTSKPFSE